MALHVFVLDTLHPAVLTSGANVLCFLVPEGTQDEGFELGGSMRLLRSPENCAGTGRKDGLTGPTYEEGEG